MALITRYSVNERGAIVITGNTLGLSRLRTTQNPGTDNAINQFVTTNVALPVPPAWSSIVDLSQQQNITFDWTLNSSAAFLNMLAGYTVLYAELLWGGMSISLSTGGNPPVDVSAFINNPITFTTPAGTTSVSPDPATAQTAVIAGSGTFYIRTQNVTNLVSAGGIGRYVVGGVPSAVNLNEVNTLNHAGWTLIVAYENPSLPPRNMNVYVGEELIGGGATTNVTVTGFLTPPTGAINARILVGAQEGDANLTGDQMLFGPNAGSLQALSGPNNPATNFFCSQLNIGDPNNANVGNIDTSGTYGARNANAATGTLITGGRQGWDVTNVNGSAAMTNNQSSALVQLTSSGDVYVLNTLGVQIDTILVTGTKAVDKATAALGDVLTYTVNLTNEGGVAQTVTFQDAIPSGTTLVPNSLTATLPFTGNLQSGVVIQNLGAGQTVQIQWQVLIGNTIPNPNPISNTGQILITGLPTQNTNTVTTDVLNADMSVVKVASSVPFTPGSVETYSITIANAGPNPAQNVFMQDAIPAVFLNPEFSSDGGSTWNPWPGLFGFGTVAVGQSNTILIRGTLSSSATGSVVNTATVTSTTPDPNPSNNSSTTTTTISPSADIAVTKTASSASVIAGNPISYTILVQNLGPSVSQNVVLTDTVPTSVDNVEFSLDGGLTWNPFVSPYAVGTMNPGTSVTILLRGNVDTATLANVVNTAVVSSDTPDPNPNNNTSTSTVTVTTQADVSIVKTLSPNSPTVGEVLTYTNVISNIGPSDALDVEVADTVPTNLTNPEYSTDNVNWNPWTGSFSFGTLAHNGSFTLYIRGTVNDNDPPFTNSATVTSTTFDPNLLNNTSSATTDTSDTTITVTKTADPKPVNAGNLITYTLLVENTGLFDAQNVTFTDPLPGAITTPEYSLDGGSSWILWDTTLNVGTIVVGGSVTLLIRGTVAPSYTGNLVNTVTVTSTTADTVTDTDITTVTTSADIYIQKSVTPNPVVCGRSLLYTLLIGNNGPSNSLDVILQDVPPSALENVMISTDGGITFIPWVSPFTYNVGTVVANATPTTILISATVKTGTTQDFTNTANVFSASTPDPNLNNNTASALSNILSSADLRVSKVVNSNPITAGQEILYTLVVTNDGVSCAQSVVLTDLIDAAVQNPQYSTTTPVGPWTDWTGALGLGVVSANTSRTIYIRGTVDTSAVGTIENTATVSSPTPDPNPEDNTVTITTSITPSSDLSVVKSTLEDAIIAGQKIKYRKIITNYGPSDAQNVMLADVVPSNIRNPIYSLDGGATWNPWVTPLSLGTVIANTTVEVLIEGTLSSESVGSLSNSAFVSTTTPDPNPNNNNFTVVSDITTLADIAVFKLSSPNPVNVGSYLTYSIAVANFGPSNAVNLTLTDIVPGNIIAPEYSLDGGATWSTWTGTISLVNAPSGLLQMIMIRGLVDYVTDDITNTAVVSSDTFDPKPSNNVSSIITSIGNYADVSVVKTASSASVILGDTVTYTIVVTNNGPDSADGVVLQDQPSTNLGEVLYSIDQGVTWLPWTGVYNIGTMAANTSITFLLQGIVVDDQNGFIVNSAIVNTTSTEFNPDNNISTVVTVIDELAQLVVTKSVANMPVFLNCPIVYAIEITNQGPNDATNVVVIDELPCGIIHPEFSIDNGVTWNCWSGVFTIDRIPLGATNQILIRGIVKGTENCVVNNTIQVYSGTDSSSDPISASFTVPVYKCNHCR